MMMGVICCLSKNRYTLITLIRLCNIMDELIHYIYSRVYRVIPFIQSGSILQSLKSYSNYTVVLHLFVLFFLVLVLHFPPK